MVPKQEHSMSTRTTLFIPPRRCYVSCHWRQFREDDNLLTTKKRKGATLSEGDSFNPLIFTEEEVVEVNEKEISGSLEEIVAGDSNLELELTENEFLRYQSKLIGCVDAMTILKRRRKLESNRISTKKVQQI